MPLLLPPGPQWHSLKKTVKAVYSVQWNLSFRTPLIKGHLHSGDTKFCPGKMLTLFMYLMPLLKGHLYSPERDPFSGSYFNPRLATRLK